jgi:hypothetical protein
MGPACGVFGLAPVWALSAYTGRALKWDWAMQASKLDLRPPREEFGDLPIRPVAVHGQTPLVGPRAVLDEGDMAARGLHVADGGCPRRATGAWTRLKIIPSPRASTAGPLFLYLGNRHSSLFQVSRNGYGWVVFPSSAASRILMLRNSMAPP